MTDRHPEPVHPRQRQFARRKAPLGRRQGRAAILGLDAPSPRPTGPQGAAVGDVSRSPASQTPGPRESATKALLFRANRAMNDRAAEAVVAGLPAEVIDGLVEDLAEAVVAMLLSTAPAEPGEEDDASGDLRQI